MLEIDYVVNLETVTLQKWMQVPLSNLLLPSYSRQVFQLFTLNTWVQIPQGAYVGIVQSGQSICLICRKSLVRIQLPTLYRLVAKLLMHPPYMWETYRLESCRAHMFLWCNGFSIRGFDPLDFSSSLNRNFGWIGKWCPSGLENHLRKICRFESCFSRYLPSLSSGRSVGC